MTRLLLMALSLATVGCVTTYKSIFIDYQLIDQPNQERYEVWYRNDSDKAMCVAVEHWPNAIGRLDLPEDYLLLLVGEERFPGLGFNGGYCPDGCSIRIASGEEEIGHISYANFNLPARLYYEEKVLEYRPQAYICR